MIRISTVAKVATSSSKVEPLPKGVARESGPTDFYTELRRFQEKILSAKEVSAKELILYQIKAGEFGLRVELLSKAADSLLGVVRKLQNN